MSDIIKLLPDSVANQIAAGEVVQRPASVVKELLENSVDAGATQIKLIIKDAGKTLIQVTDNGFGMSETDARMCFERHATSKINQATDLFALRTMGFRGEAMASIASVARVELKSRRAEDTLGTEIIMEGSKIESQQSCQCPKGTNISVKNLFFNIPARRNFLKSDNVEKNHIYNEFIRVAMANPDKAFSYYINNQLSHHSDAGNLQQRIVQLMGPQYKSRIIPIEEQTEVVNLSGFVGKPEFARKSRGEQYFFVNNRFIKSPYLNHAVENAFYDLIPDDAYPSFFVFLDIDPEQIDVNVHPTKTEIKFQDEKLLYQIIKASVKKSLGKFNIAPSLDFERESSFDNFHFDKNKPVKIPSIDVNPEYNPFEQNIAGGGGNNISHKGQELTHKSTPQNWEKIFPSQQDFENISTPSEDNPSSNQVSKLISPDWENETPMTSNKKFMHLHSRYILTSIKSGLMLIDQRRAHERILFEKHLKRLENHKSSSQTLLFPEQIQLSPQDAELLKQIIKNIQALGFEINTFGHNTFVINAIPSELPENENLQELMESILENYKINQVDIKLDVKVNLARSLARSLAIKQGKALNDEEMNALSDALFSCEMPFQTPSGKSIVHTMKLEDLAAHFDKKA